MYTSAKRICTHRDRTALAQTSVVVKKTTLTSHYQEYIHSVYPVLYLIISQEHLHTTEQSALLTESEQYLSLVEHHFDVIYLCGQAIRLTYFTIVCQHKVTKPIIGSKTWYHSYHEYVQAHYTKQKAYMSSHLEKVHFIHI